jgi:hypothetical protein
LEIVMSLAGQILRAIGLDRNPLRRTSDRVEAWVTVLLMAALVTVVPYAAWRAGRADHAAGVNTERVERKHRFRSEAVLLPDPRAEPVAVRPPNVVPATRTAYPRVRKPARWTGADGAEHYGTVAVAVPGEPGTRVPVWVDDRGRLADQPRQRVETLTDSVAVAVLTAGALVGLLVAVRILMCRLLDARRLTQWQDAWWRCEPRWSGR